MINILLTSKVNYNILHVLLVGPFCELVKSLTKHNTNVL